MSCSIHDKLLQTVSLVNVAQYNVWMVLNIEVAVENVLKCNEWKVMMCEMSEREVVYLGDYEDN